MAHLDAVNQSARLTMPFEGRMLPFVPVVLRDGYLPIEDHGLIGDGSTGALVGRDGTIDWLCVPRFDSAPIFCSILDAEKGGAFRVSVDGLIGARHRYLGHSPILITELQTTSGVLRITDVMPVRPGTDLNSEGNPEIGELLRCFEVVEGAMTVGIDVSFHNAADVERCAEGLSVRAGADLDCRLLLESSRQLDGLKTEWKLSKGEGVQLCLRWNGGTGASSVDAPVAAISNTIETWASWLKAFDYNGPQPNHVLRSAITIKLLDFLPSGAMIAAPTTSLPEQIGGERNWDYRYVWVRDAAFTVNALRQIGLDREAWQFLSWILSRAQGDEINVMYTLHGETSIPERLDDELSGYEGSRPVRWGNGAHSQIQHDVYGELVDCAFQWSNHGGVISDRLWHRIRTLVDRAAAVWDKPDAGIWEVRTKARVQTYSAGMCHVALDRGAKMAQRFGLDGQATPWSAERDRIRDAILTRAWNDDGNYLSQTLRSKQDHTAVGHLDAALLALPIRRVVPASHPRVLATINAIDRELSAGNELLYRYIPEKSPDGLTGNEGAFVLCSFWMIENLTMHGRIREAQDRFDRLCARTNALGLLPEEIDPGSGRFLGNFPQAFSHLGLISSGVALGRAINGVSPVGSARWIEEETGSSLAR